MSLYSFNTLFTKGNSSRLIYELAKPLETKTLVVFNLVFANNTVLSCFFILFFLIIDLYFLIHAVVSQIFNYTAELAIPLVISTKETKSEIETYPVIAETKFTNYSVNIFCATYKAYSSSLLHMIIACNHLPLFKIFSNFIHFCPNFQIFSPFSRFTCPFSEKSHPCPYFLE